MTDKPSLPLIEHEFDPGHSDPGDADADYCWAHVTAFGNGDCGQPRSAHRAEPPSAEPEPEAWRCEACGANFDAWQLGHSRARHASDCDGSCRNCPVEEQCGPISRVGAEPSRESMQVNPDELNAFVTKVAEAIWGRGLISYRFGQPPSETETDKRDLRVTILSELLPFIGARDSEIRRERDKGGCACVYKHGVHIRACELHQEIATLRGQRDHYKGRTERLEAELADANQRAERLATGEAWADHAASCHGSGQADAIRDANAGLIDDMLQPLIERAKAEGAQAERERCAKLVCIHCRDNAPLKAQAGELLYHVIEVGSGPTYTYACCKASELGILSDPDEPKENDGKI